MIWCVEDDESIRDIEVYALKSSGFEAAGISDGEKFWEKINSAGEKPELVVMDIMLPGIDGTELVKRMRKNREMADIPVVMATAKGEEYDRVTGLDIGADYYLTKPFGVMELVSCVKAVLRRCGKREGQQVLESAGVSVNIDEHTVTVDGERIILTLKEYEILRTLMQNKGRVFTRDQLFNDIWGEDYYGETRTVDVHIRTLRQKLGKYADLIETVRGVGYRLEEGK